MRPTLVACALLLAAACGKDPSPAPAAQGSAADPATPGKLLAVGEPAPKLNVTAHDGTVVDLAAMKGAPVVVYFYPRDETPGCTVEAEAFRDQLPELAKGGARVVGVSMDSLESHRAFAANRGINFPLLADEDGAIARAFGVSTAGGHADRVTFIVGADGAIARVFPDVRPQGHAAEVAAALAGT